MARLRKLKLLVNLKKHSDINPIKKAFPLNRGKAFFIYHTVICIIQYAQ